MRQRRILSVSQFRKKRTRGSCVLNNGTGTLMDFDWLPFSFVQYKQNGNVLCTFRQVLPAKRCTWRMVRFVESEIRLGG